MADGHLGKCKECTKIDLKISNGNVTRHCLVCDKEFHTTNTEVKRKGGLTCSRNCYYQRLRKIIKREEQSPNWKGDKVKDDALHGWVIRHLGRPMKCSKCGREDQRRYEWANISRKYKRDLSDWMRLCKKCHIIYDGSKYQRNYKRLNIEDFKKLEIKL